MTSQKAIKNNKSILDVLGEDQIDFFLRSLRNKVRNINKKLKEIQELQEKSKTEQLKTEQLQKVSKREEFQDTKREMNKIASLYLQARSQDKKEEGGATTSAVSQPTKIQKKVEQVKEQKKQGTNPVRSTVRSIVRLVAVSNYLNTQAPARLSLQKKLVQEIESLSNNLNTVNNQYTDVQKRLEKYISTNTLLQETVDTVIKSEGFKKWGSGAPSSASVSGSGATHSGTGKSEISASTSKVEELPASNYPSSAPVAVQSSDSGSTTTVHEEHKRETVVSNTATSAATTAGTGVTSGSTVSAVSTGVTLNTNAPSHAPATNDGGVIADQEADDDRFKESDNQDNQVENEQQNDTVPANNNNQGPRSGAVNTRYNRPRQAPAPQKEDDEWIIAGQKKDEYATQHHRPQGEWRERGPGDFERPQNQRRGPRRDNRDGEAGRKEPRTNEGGVDREKIREDRERRGENGEFGKRSNQRRRKESGNLRVPEYIPKSQVNKE